MRDIEPYTTLVDIYEAMGGVANEDRSRVEIDVNTKKPFKIELTVNAVSVKQSIHEPDMITFTVMFPPVFVGPEGYTYSNLEFEMPVALVKIIKDDE